jgi:eukaryotic-like serine/threonine-protein kinase
MFEQISSYRLEGEIARGGMGIVYRGVHTVFQESVAIKAIFPDLTLNPEMRERFLNEARIQRRLLHPNIVQIREFLIEQGRLYIVMELIAGDTLRARIGQGADLLELKQKLALFGQALSGLAFAHVQGVIHRDIKPSNIMITSDGVAKLTDFGIARTVDAGVLTRTGTSLGTPSYMSPEQIQGVKVDSRSDIYSMGVTLYEMLTGRVPFLRPEGSDSDFGVLSAHIAEPPVPPGQFSPGLPPFVEAAVLKALAKRPEDRFQSSEEFATALGIEAATPQSDAPIERTTPLPPSLAFHSVAAGSGSTPSLTALVSESTPAPAAIAVATPPPVTPSPRTPPPQQPSPRQPSSRETEQPVVFASPQAPRRGKARYWLLAVVFVVLAAGGVAIWRSGGVAIWRFLGPQPLKQTLVGHTGYVYSVAFGPSGRLLASGSADETIKIWDLSSGTVKETLTGHVGQVFSVALGPNGRTLVSGSGDRTIKVWDVPTGTLKQTLTGHNDLVTSVALSPDGNLLASGSTDGTVRLWDLTTDAPPQTLETGNVRVESVAFGPNGQQLAAGGFDGAVKLWDLQTRTLKQTLAGADVQVTSVAFGPNGRWLASGSYDGSVRLWQLPGGTLSRKLAGHDGVVRAVAFSPDGRLIASGADDASIKLWGVLTGELRQTFTGHHGVVYAVAFSPDGRLLASGSSDESIKVWNVVK